MNKILEQADSKTINDELLVFLDSLEVEIDRIKAHVDYVIENPILGSDINKEAIINSLLSGMGLIKKMIQAKQLCSSEFDLFINPLLKFDYSFSLVSKDWEKIFNLIIRPDHKFDVTVSCRYGGIDRLFKIKSSDHAAFELIYNDFLS